MSFYRLNSGEDALFALADGKITLASRGGSKASGIATNTEYGPALRAILTRIVEAGLVVEDAYVDSKAAQRIPLSERRIVDPANNPQSASSLFRAMSRRMTAVGQADGKSGGNSTKRITIKLAGNVPTERLIELLEAVPFDQGSTKRLPVEMLRKVRAMDLWNVREQLLNTRDFTPFDDSDKFDVLLEDGQRLPPKALFGRALTQSLGSEVRPRHFTGGDPSPCFSILREHGFRIVRKGMAAEADSPDETAWPEGDKEGRWHLRSERRSGLSDAKKQEFREEHGRLFCERCGIEPIRTYQTAHADACIEVHHARISVADMLPGHKTKLSDLQCLCANCHRIEHKLMRVQRQGTGGGAK